MMAAGGADGCLRLRYNDGMTLASPTRRRWFQFSLRTLLIVALVLSIPLAWVAARMRQAGRQREAVEAIRKLGGRVEYDHQRENIDGYRVLDLSRKLPGRKWLRGSFGDDFFSNVDAVTLDGQKVSDADLQSLAGLSRVKELTLTNIDITDAGLEYLKRLEQLEFVYLRGSLVTDEGVRSLQQSLPKCVIEK
jgi:hypothetical protein